VQIYEQWDSGRPYPHPASLAYWEHERDQWLRHIEQHVLPPRLADKAAHDLHLQIELQRLDLPPNDGRLKAEVSA
jgi:hypothetical protein